MVELATLLLVAAAVQRLRVLQKLQAGLDDLNPRAEGAIDVVESHRKAIPLFGDFSQPGLDLALRQAAISG
ncbi:hypothetical protein [Streptomyces sp. NPDC090083]|uniref:hypothetical protein n=1 Tax=Streptomyces sp. NPDC090083 TaxID=3365941 RepID=UPI003830CBD3